MPSKARPEMLYWDTSVFLHYFNRAPQYHQPIADVLQDVRISEGTRLIITSAITIAEVSHVQEEVDDPTVRDTIEDTMDMFWNDRSILRIIDVYPEIARGARRWQRRIREDGKKLKPLDALHLATAAALSVQEMHSYDHHHLRLNVYTPFRICQPRVSYGDLFGTAEPNTQPSFSGLPLP